MVTVWLDFEDNFLKNVDVIRKVKSMVGYDNLGHEMSSLKVLIIR